MASKIIFKNSIPLVKFKSLFKVLSKDFSVASESKIYELRIYSIKPKYAKTFKKFIEEKIHIREQVSKMFGFWYTEMGGINEAVHIWEFDNITHRTRVRSELVNNHEWQAVMDKATPMWASQTNLIMTKLPEFEINYPLINGVYDLRISQMQGLPKEGLEVSTAFLKIQNGVTLIGAFTTLWGPQNSIISLWHGKDFSVLSSAQEALIYESHKEIQNTWKKTLNTYSRAMTAATFSPLK